MTNLFSKWGVGWVERKVQNSKFHPVENFSLLLDARRVRRVRARPVSNSLLYQIEANAFHLFDFHLQLKLGAERPRVFSTFVKTHFQSEDLILQD
jgi:hypothetical protein